MHLHELQISGFRRIREATVRFGETTFLIGENNSGKSSVLEALDLLLSGPKKLNPEEFYSEIDPQTGRTTRVAGKVIFTAEFRNLPVEARTWRGFKGRVWSYAVEEGSDDTGLSIVYRRTYEAGSDVVIELKSFKREMKAQFKDCKTPRELIEKGADAQVVEDLFPDLGRKLAKADQLTLGALAEVWDVLGEEDWFKNPGGIPGNVLSKLPKVLVIPAESRSEEISNEKTGALAKTLKTLFEDVRGQSENYKKAQALLNLLAKELDPGDEDSEFGKMMLDLNSVLGSVFPESRINVRADLSDPDKVLLPQFDIRMQSNVETSIRLQGTGMVRSAVFGLLRFREKWLAQREDRTAQSLIIGFEEPEMYLHPSAAGQMRDVIYALSSKSTQFVAATHSPFLIDLSREPRQILNRFRPIEDGVEVVAFNVTHEFKSLAEDDRDYVKMILKVDDHVARGFFTKSVIVVEGDSEVVALSQALARLPDGPRLRIRADFDIVRARGKAAIISLAKYLKALGIDFWVIHDQDGEKEAAARFNAPIAEAVGEADRVVVLVEDLEEALGYEAPSSEKPYHVYKQSLYWGEAWDGVPGQWREALETVFGALLKEQEVEPAADEGDR